MLFIFLWSLALDTPTFSHILSISSTFFAQISLFLPKLLFWLENLYSCSRIPLKLTLSQDFSIPPCAIPAKCVCLNIEIQWTLFSFRIFSTSLVFASLSLPKWGESMPKDQSRRSNRYSGWGSCSSSSIK